MSKILILSTTREATPFQENVSPRQVSMMRDCLAARGYDAIDKIYHPQTIENDIRLFGPDTIFNLVYGFRSDNPLYNELQPQSTERIERLLPRTIGSCAAVQAIVQDKKYVGDLLTGLVDYPRQVTLEELSGDTSYVVKPRYGACHRDVQFVTTVSDYLAVAGMSPHELILQEYVEGPEYTIGVIERGGKPYTFTPLMVDFDSDFLKAPRLMNWDTFRWTLRPTQEHEDTLRSVAERIFTELKMKDYARFDIRMRDDYPVLLDINALPNLSPSGSLLPRMAAIDGQSYGDLICTLVENAIARFRSTAQLSE